MVQDVRLAVIGTGSYLPERVVTNAEFANRPLQYHDAEENVSKIDTFSEADIVKRSGILTRRLAEPQETPDTMGYRAARIALEKANLKPSDLTGIIVGTVSQRSNYPSAAVRIAEKLEISGCCAFDIAAACCGYIEAMIDANSRVLRRTGPWLVIGSEHMSSMTETDSVNTYLFGDGAGAAVLVPSSDARGIVAEHSGCDPLDGKAGCIFRGRLGTLRMPDGGKVLEEAVRAMTSGAECVKKIAGWQHADVYIPHQANERIIARVERTLADKGALVYRTISSYGNMSSATCAVALDEALQKGFVRTSTADTPGSRVVLTSFGSGLYAAAMAIQF